MQIKPYFKGFHLLELSFNNTKTTVIKSVALSVVRLTFVKWFQWTEKLPALSCQFKAL